MQVFWIGYEGEREHYADIPPAGGMEALCALRAGCTRGLRQA